MKHKSQKFWNRVSLFFKELQHHPFRAVIVYSGIASFVLTFIMEIAAIFSGEGADFIGVFFIVWIFLFLFGLIGLMIISGFIYFWNQ